MASNDVELLQSFCRRYFNKIVKKHFQDVTGDDDSSLSKGISRQLIKRICLHKDNDTMLLTIARMLIWWVEARGLFEGIIYGIPSTNFHETNKFKPQVAIYWRESAEDAKLNNRYPLRAKYTVRWRGDYASRNDIDKIRNKVNLIFNKSIPHNFTKGREKWSYYDLEKGYRLIVTARDRSEAVSVINSLLEIQDDNPLNEEFLGKSEKEKNYTLKKTIRVNSEVYDLPEERQIGKVLFTHAEFKVHGMAKDITLISNLSGRVSTKLV